MKPAMVRRGTRRVGELRHPGRFRGWRGLAVALLLPLLLAACGGGKSDAPGAADTTAPTVLSTSPAGSASGVAVNASVGVTFSEAIDAATITGTTFTVTAAGVPVPGTVNSNSSTATFTPTSALAGGTVYTATVSTAVKDAAGNPLAAANSWSFTTVNIVAANAWSMPERLDSGDGYAASPAIAATSEDVLTGAAQATAVWVQEGADFELSVYANRFRQGVWEGTELVENQSRGNGASATNPRVAMGAFGRAIMTWTYGGNGSYAVWSNVFDGPLSSANALQISPIGGNASGAQVSFDGGGHDVFIVWQQYDSSRLPAAYRVFQRQYLFVPCEFTLPCGWDPADFGWRSTSLVETASNDADSPQVSAWGSGNAVAVWPKFRAGIWANTHATPAGWATPVQVNPGSSGGSSPMVAAAADGSAVAVWIESVAGRWTLFGSRLSGTGWSAPIAVDDSTAGTAANPQVVVDAGGNAMIAWTQGDVGAGTLYARRCLAGPLTACSTPAKIGGLVGYAEAPRLASAPNGDAIVVWAQADGAGPRRVQANHYSAATTSWRASPLQLDAAESFEPQVAIDKRGHATAVWSRHEGGKTHIYASRYVQ